MKYHLTLFVIFFYILSGNTQEMQPTLGKIIDKNEQGEADFLAKRAEFDRLLDKIPADGSTDNFTAREKEIFNSMTEVDPGYWEVIGGGCSWYCGGGPRKVTASSALKSSGDITYAAENAHDLSYKTAWVEGVEGQGVGESLTYHFAPESPRITKIIVVNGYVKSAAAWKNNSRVKKLKLFLNEKEIAVLHLADSKAEQSFTFSPLGNGDRADFEKLKQQPAWTLRFEILEVYPGEKYEDTVITEIYFDGTDVH